MMCETCQGNGEVITDWHRYLHPKRRDKGGETVTECPDCGGTGDDGEGPHSSWLDVEAAVVAQAST